MTDDDGSAQPEQTWYDRLRNFGRGHQGEWEPIPVALVPLLFFTGLTYLLSASLLGFFQLIGWESAVPSGQFAITPLMPVFVLMSRHPIRRRWIALVGGGVVGITVGILAAHGLYGHFVHIWADFCGAAFGGLLGVLAFAMVTHLPV